MPSDTPIYRDGKRLVVTRRAYDRIYKPRGWRLRPPKDSLPTGGDQTADTADDQKE